MANPNALYLLADHIKLSLLERQRPESTSAAADNAAEDGHISQAIDQLREGIDALKEEQSRLDAAGEEGKALDIADALPALEKTFKTLSKQFRSLTEAPAKKAVRFDPTTNTAAAADAAADAARADLFNRPYTDDPDEDVEASAAVRFADHDNVQLHQMHAQIISEQDEQLDALGASISRQRELSMQMGEELDSHMVLLEEGERLVDRQQSRIERARRQVGKISRSAGDCKQMVAIVVLILILVLLIIILK